ncbi:MAG TPA: U32 family peptidase, partial [Megamonas funiformis]|nr:U32 family peptidase [Megamonas funiformis]
SDVEIEVFAHGALCVCYSGQCLMSSMIGGRSGNRGRCAQPCRLPYTLVDKNNNNVLKDAGQYLLSPRDMNTLELIPEFIEAQKKFALELGAIQNMEQQNDWKATGQFVSKFANT